MKRVLQYLALFVAVIGGWWVLNNQYVIRDWVALRGYDAPDYVVQYADDTAMSDHGRRIFYVTKPELNDQQQFNDNCSTPEKTLVLGCYTGGRIYVYSVDDDRLDGVEEVTAAHEMLHAAYARLSSGDKRDLDELLEKQMAQIDDPRIIELVDQYREDDPSVLANEMHSIFGTEVRDLLEELEEHYKQYFYDRQQVVAISESYEQVFVDISGQIKSLEQEISALKSQIEDQEASITVLQVEIDSEGARLEELRETGDIPGYNAGVPGYNAMVADYNAQVDNYKVLIVKHNDKVEERNQLATTQNELVHSLDSKFERL